MTIRTVEVPHNLTTEQAEDILRHHSECEAHRQVMRNRAAGWIGPDLEGAIQDVTLRLSKTHWERIRHRPHAYQMRFRVKLESYRPPQWGEPPPLHWDETLAGDVNTEFAAPPFLDAELARIERNGMRSLFDLIQSKCFPSKPFSPPPLRLF